MHFTKFFSVVSGLVATATALAPGSYIVTSAVSGQAIGRQHYEDKSLGPKRIVVGDSSQIGNTWEVSVASDGSYNLINSGWSVGDEDNLVWACYSGDCSEDTWILGADVRRGPNAYVVGSKKGYGAWIVSPNESQLTFGLLYSAPSMPPHYPAAGVFYFTPV